MELRWAVCLYRVCIRSGSETTVAGSQRGSAGGLRCGCWGQPEGQGWQDDRRQHGDDASSPVRLLPQQHGTGAEWVLVEMHLQAWRWPCGRIRWNGQKGFWGLFGALLLYMSGFGLSPSLFRAQGAYSDPWKPDIISPNQGCKSLLVAWQTP